MAEIDAEVRALLNELGNSQRRVSGDEMFFRKQKANKLLKKYGPLSKIAWDDETVNWIADSKRLDVNITHISKTVSLGKMRVDDDRSKDQSESAWKIHGVMRFSKLVHVNITFVGHDNVEFGEVFRDNSRDYDYCSLPILELWLSDQGEQKAQLIYSALRDAIISGQKYTGVRFWKKRGRRADDKVGYGTRLFV